MDLGIQGRTAVVCASSRGLGRACAMELARAGCRVAVNGREPLTLETTAAAIRAETGAEVIAVPGDVTRPDEVTRILKEAADALGGLDGIVNNAGVAFPNKIENLDAAQVQEQIAINLFAPIMTCRGIIPYLRARGGGRIINVSSATVHTMARRTKTGA